MGTIIIGNPIKLTKRLDYDANDLLIYLGEAAAGSNETASSWRIQKYVYDANDNITDVLWADGNTDQDNDWSNRASLNYS